MQRKNDHPGKGNSSAVVGIIAGLVGIAIGFFATKAMSEEEKTPEQPRQIPVASSINNNNGQSEITSTNNTTDCEDITCPITQEVMTDPFVSRVCGHSFERAAIFSWVQKKQTCPKCNATLKQDDLIRNYTLKSVIEHFMQAKK